MFSTAVLVLVGGKGHGDAVLRRMAKDSGLAGNLRLITRQPLERISTFLPLADVLVSPLTQGENLPLKIFDYLVAGRPIVATDIESHCTFLYDQVATLTTPVSSVVADAVVRLLQDSAQAAAPGSTAREFSGRRLG